jgi:GntR family transcriptional regulator / MocR family aminotransferase
VADVSKRHACDGVVVVVRSRAGSLDLFLELDMAACPPRERRATLEARLREAIASGRLGPGTVLPSSRVLAEELGLSRGTVVDAYSELVAQGCLRARAGGETAVAGQPRAADSAAGGGVEFPPVDLRSGAADLAVFPSGQWAAALQSALAATPGVWLDYPPREGVEELRSVLVGYLARSRGVLGSVDRVVMCCGLSHGLALLTDALCAAGRPRIAMEDPCLPRHRVIVAARGADIVPIPVDDDGIRVDAIVAADPDAVLLTPAHQYPMGVTLSVERREQLVAWARRRRRLLVEDDYDAEFRYERSPLGALQALAPDRVVYAGTLSKTLVPGLRLAWLVLPDWFVTPVVGAKWATGAENSVLEQLAFAELIRSQRYDRHLRRMRGVFRHRRDRFLAALETAVPHLRVTTITAGLHFLVQLPEGGPDESHVLQRARQLGVALYGLGRCWHGEPRSQGLIVGFGRPPEHAVDDAIRSLALVLQQASSDATGP